MYTLVTHMVAPRHLRAAILKDDRNTLTVEMHPYLFYKKTRTNYTDVNVPVFIEMSFNAQVCSADFVNSVELHDKFKEAITFLVKSEYWNCALISIPSKELYDLYLANREVMESIEDIALYDNDETLNIVNAWEVKDTLRIDNKKHYISLFRKSKLDLYKTKWWTDEEKYKNETT